MAYITGTVVAIGDSTTGDYPNRIQADQGAITTIHNAAHSGIGWSHDQFTNLATPNLISLAASEVDIYVGVSPQPFLLLLAGSNDIFYGWTGAQTYASFETYVQERIEAGWVSNRIIALTMMSRSPPPSGIETQRVAYNAAIVSGQATYGYVLSRLDLNANIGAPNASQNATYFSDGTHPTTAGSQEIANVTEAAAYVSGKVRRLVKIGS